MRLLEPSEILAGFEERPPLLISGARNLPERQRTLRGAIAWSYDLLDAPQRLLLGRLAIFSGGCTLDAAEAICNPDRELGINTLEAIAGLVDQSLVRRAANAGETRFGMLEIIREYGRERLEADGGTLQIGRRHIDYFLGLGQAGEQHLLGPDQVGWLDRFEREHDNDRGPVDRAVDTGQTDEALLLAASVWRFWFQRGYLREGRAWLEQLNGTAARRHLHRARQRLRRIGWLWRSGLTTQTRRRWPTRQRCVSTSGSGTAKAKAETMYNLAYVPVMRGDFDLSRERSKKSLAIARDIGRADLVATEPASAGNFHPRGR